MVHRAPFRWTWPSNVYDQYPTYSCRKYVGPKCSSVLWGCVNSVMRDRILCGVLTVGAVCKLNFKFVSNLTPNKSPPIESDRLTMLAQSVCSFSTLHLEKRGPCIHYVKAKDLYSSYVWVSVHHLYYIMLCYVMLSYVILYYIILYYIILYYIILYYIKNQQDVILAV